jgi:preprotein translocase subunit YajC
MKPLLFTLLFLSARASDAFATSPGGQGSDPTQFLLMIAVFFAIFYFIVIRPQQKEQKSHQERISTLQKGDRVVTSGGLHGTVRSTKEKTLVVEIADGVKVTVNRSAISAVLEGGGSKSKPGDEDEDEE